MRDSLTITLLPGPSNGIATVNGNVIGNSHCITMLQEWLATGKEITLVLASAPLDKKTEGIPYTTVKLVRA
jgi:hypothetical protein